MDQRSYEQKYKINRSIENETWKLYTRKQESLLKRKNKGGYKEKRKVETLTLIEEREKNNPNSVSMVWGNMKLMTIIDFLCSSKKKEKYILMTNLPIFFWL